MVQQHHSHSSHGEDFGDEHYRNDHRSHRRGSGGRHRRGSRSGRRSADTNGSSRHGGHYHRQNKRRNGYNLRASTRQHFSAGSSSHSHRDHDDFYDSAFEDPSLEQPLEQEHSFLQKLQHSTDVEKKREDHDDASLQLKKGRTSGSTTSGGTSASSSSSAMISTTLSSSTPSRNNLRGSSSIHAASLVQKTAVFDGGQNNPPAPAPATAGAADGAAPAPAPAPASPAPAPSSAAEPTEGGTTWFGCFTGILGSPTYLAVTIAVVLLVLLGLYFINWRRFGLVKRLLRFLHWDKYGDLELTVTVHDLQLEMQRAITSGDATCAVKIVAGGQEYWTEQKAHNYHYEQAFEVFVPQGYRKIVVELWTVSGFFKSKHRTAQRIIDILEVVVSRRPYGCVRKEWFSLMKKSDGSKDAEEFKSGKAQLSIQYSEDVHKISDEKVQMLERFTEHPVSQPMSAALSKAVAGHLEKKINGVDDLLPMIGSCCACAIKWVSKFGFPRTKYADVFLAKNAKGKDTWYFAIFESESARSRRSLTETKASASLLTISALVPDPKKPGYVCLQYQPSKKADIHDLYFQVKDDSSNTMASIVWIEAMHVMIECVRRLRMLQLENKRKEMVNSPVAGPPAIE
ncbi:unnamed protein product [Amoebophrya sp. A120]|nr:unnamed protein product [Amoebophrya sp. A120]|eukprot:GSA120T00024694001.1